ncbi:MAG: carbohydrate kinase family protein [Dehalococcoidia bacterium]|nr:carbohydrate kinase family protein [Dehalococcoidia bacterium]
MDIEVIGFGALNIDQIYSVARMLRDGEAPMTEFLLSPGGSAANTIYGLARLGVVGGFIGTVGDDEAGGMLLDDFRNVSVDTGQIRIKKAKTGTTLCLTDKRGRRAIYVLPGANSLLESDDIDLDYIKQARILHLSSFAGERHLEIQKQLIDHIPTSVKVSFAPGSIYTARGLADLSPIIKRTYVLFINRKEIEQLTGEEFQKGAQSCLGRGCQVVAVTLGEGMKRKATTAACYLASGDREYMIEAIRTKRVPGDTIGAGDAFAAGFLFGLLREKNLEECGYLGELVAQFSIARSGARAGLPSLRQLRQRYEKLWGKPL